jgi:hypothetical protein
MTTIQKPLTPVFQIVSGFCLGLLFLLLSIQVIFPIVHIPFFGIILNALSLVDLIIHETGHLFFGFLGQFIGILGGTLAQLFIPLTGIFLSLRKRRWIYFSVFLFWLGQSLVQISYYVGDAQSQKLKLFSPGLVFGGSNPIHDWHYLLDKTGLLWADQILGGMILLGGITFLLGSAAVLFAWGAGWKRLVTI